MGNALHPPVTSVVSASKQPPRPPALDHRKLRVRVPGKAGTALRYLFVVFDAGESNLLFQTVELLQEMA